HDLLRDKQFGFREQNIQVLAEADPENRPTRANIERALGKLRDRVGEGDIAVVYLAGHGSRLPQLIGASPEDYQPDGKEPVFMPRDIGRWTWTSQTVENAIRGKELRAWLRPLHDKGARVVVIVDACQSAALVRGSPEVDQSGGARVRYVAPQALGVPPEAF